MISCWRGSKEDKIFAINEQGRWDCQGQGLRKLALSGLRARQLSRSVGPIILLRLISEVD